MHSQGHFAQFLPFKNVLKHFITFWEPFLCNVEKWGLRQMNRNMTNMKWCLVLIAGNPSQNILYSLFSLEAFIAKCSTILDKFILSSMDKDEVEVFSLQVNVMKIEPFVRFTRNHLTLHTSVYFQFWLKGPDTGCTL